MRTLLATMKQNNQHKAYTWNMLSSVRPYSVVETIAITADDCDFAGRLGQLEPRGRLRCGT